MTSEVPWQNGWYVQPDNPLSVLHVQGDKVVHEKLAEIGIDFDRLIPKETETWTFGQFGETPPEIKEITGQDTYDIEMVHKIPVVGEMTTYGVLSQDKKTIHCLGHQQNLTSRKWLSPEEFEKLKDDSEPWDQMVCPYPKEPGTQGKIIWLSGPPGAGKTTTGNMLMKTGQFVCYEADTFMFHLNPYLPVAKDEKEAAWLIMKQKSLKGLDKERVEAVDAGYAYLAKAISGEPVDTSLGDKFYGAIAKNIVYERQRIGGDWIIAQGVGQKVHRDVIRQIIGPDLLFITLALSPEAQNQRLSTRYEGMSDEAKQGAIAMFEATLKHFEPGTDDEDNTVHIEITPEMSREDVLNIILKTIEK